MGHVAPVRLAGAERALDHRQRNIARWIHD
jgi:hypothetical protein